MIRMINQRLLPRAVVLACSGGVDSMAALDFLGRKRTVSVAYFHHGTEHGDEAESFLRGYCEENKIEMLVGRITRDKEKSESPEEYWRKERYKFLHSIDDVVITAHHLGDAVETWLFSSLCGNPKLIPYKNCNVVRPFLPTRKEAFISWCDRKDIPYVTDPSNEDTRYTRNLIRHELMPRVLMVNPGIHKTIKKKILREN
jgi:tRNA(Ile)-lysidine synthase